MKQKLGLSALLAALVPRAWQRVVLVMMAILFAPLLLALIVGASADMLKSAPWLWALVVLALVYRLWRWLRRLRGR